MPAQSQECSFLLMKTWFRLSVSRFTAGLCLTLCCRTVTVLKETQTFPENAKSGHGLHHTLIQWVFKELHLAWVNEGKRVGLQIFHQHECKTAANYEILVKDSEMTKILNPLKMADTHYILTTLSSEICKPPSSMKTNRVTDEKGNKQIPPRWCNIPFFTYSSGWHSP